MAYFLCAGCCLLKKKIKISIVPGCEEEWLIGNRFELVSKIIRRQVIPFEFMWKWSPKAVLCSSLWRVCGAGLPSAGVPGAGDSNRELHDPSEFLLNAVRDPRNH